MAATDFYSAGGSVQNYVWELTSGMKYQYRVRDTVESYEMRKQRSKGLSKEVLAVLRISPNLKPCRKFRKADIFKFIGHLNEGKCEQCLAFFRMVDNESEMMKFLCESRN